MYEWLYDLLYQLSPFAPGVIFIATVLDIFFVTGLIFYGAAMLSMVLMLHTSGMISTEMLWLTAVVGTILGNSCNFAAGHWLGERPFVAKRLQSERIKKAERYLASRGLTLFMIIGRFITFTRPLYALLIGSLKISFQSFIVREVLLAVVWVSFWLWVILQGEELIERFF